MENKGWHQIFLEKKNRQNEYSWNIMFIYLYKLKRFKLNHTQFLFKYIYHSKAKCKMPSGTVKALAFLWITTWQNRLRLSNIFKYIYFKISVDFAQMYCLWLSKQKKLVYINRYLVFGKAQQVSWDKSLLSFDLCTLSNLHIIYFGFLLFKQCVYT